MPAEVSHFFEADRFDVSVRADDQGVIGMPDGKKLAIEFLPHQAIWRILALAAFVAHHVDLIREIACGERLQQEGHAVAFQPQGQF
ncbi:MAG: hypothetical protein WBQ64_15175, partial [Terriglobales bacterium]